MKIHGFCDLNIAVPVQLIGKHLDLLISLGYKTIAVNTTTEEESNETSKKKKGQAKELIPTPPVIQIKEDLKSKIQVLQRITVYFSDANQLQKLCKSENAKKYDIIAVVPTSFSAFQLACACKDIDLISFNPSERPILMNRKTYNLAVSNGIYFELPYAPAIADSGLRKNIIQVAHCYHAYGKSKNIVITSSAKEGSKLRSPYDIVNLGLLFGLSEEQSKQSMLNTSRSLILRAEGRRFGKTAMTMMITDLDLDSDEESDVSEPAAKKSKPDENIDSDMSYE